jgi:5-methylcytosine-specific restriction protein A
VTDIPVATAHRLLVEAVQELSAAVESGAAADAGLLSALTICEGITRRLDRLTLTTIAALQRRGTFTDRGYKSTAGALSDLLGWEAFEARRRVHAADLVCPRIGLDGSPLPPRLAATAQVFEAGRARLRHVEVIAKLLDSSAAHRLTPRVWADAEATLADKATEYTPSELRSWGTELIEKLDADGPEPDDRPPAPVNELHLLPHRGRPGGSLKGRFDDPALYDAIAALIDAKSAPRTGDDQRSAAQRQAEALAEVCGYVLDHGDVPESGGHRPHLNVTIGLEDLEGRARAAMLDFGGRLSPEALRLLACDAAVVPIVMNGAGQPLDVGRARRTIPDGLRRAVAARDRGCARCGKPPSWCEIHHIIEWENGGETKLSNCVMLCKTCHRLIHFTDWIVRIRDGLPEFIPPAWIDPDRHPRRRPLPTSSPPDPGCRSEHTRTQARPRPCTAR